MRPHLQQILDEKLIKHAYSYTLCLVHYFMLLFRVFLHKVIFDSRCRRIIAGF